MVSMMTQSSTISFGLLSLLYLIDTLSFLVLVIFHSVGERACDFNSGEVSNNAW